jgi:PAS domain S-box-containing protein
LTKVKNQGVASAVKMHFRAGKGNGHKSAGLMRMDRKLFVISLYVAMGLVLCLIVGTGLKREYDNEIAAASARTQNLTKILEGYTRQSMRRVEFHLSQAAEQIQFANDTSAAAQASQRQRLIALLPIDGLMRSFAVVDTKGAVIASTLTETDQRTPSVADRDYFVTQREHPSRKLFIGAATVSRIAGHWIIPVSVALMDPSGKFQGVLVGTLDPEYFQRFYDTIDTGPNGFVTLFTRQGMIAARSPFVESLLQRSWIDSPMFREHLPTAQAKTVRQVVAADGVERLYSYRALDDYPLVVSMGVSLTGSLALWRAQALSQGIFLAFLLAVLGVTASMLVHQLQERRRYIKSLQDSEMRRGVATDSGRVAIWEVNLKTNTLVWDANCFLLYRMRKEDFKGAFEEWSRTIHPEDLEAVIQAFQNAVAGVAKYDLTFRILWPDGAVRYIEAHAEVLKNKDGVPERVIGTNWDVTEKRLSEQAVRDSEARYKALVENSPMCIHELDLHGNLTSMNSSGLFMMGLNDQCQIQGLSYLAAVADTDRSRIANLLEDAYAGVGSAFEFKAAGAQAQYYQSCFVPLKDDAGNVVKLMGITEDITARRQSEIDLQSSLQEKSALLKEVHHRVKNNLQVITSLLRLESRRSSVEDTKAVLGEMQARIRAMALLHESLYRSGTFASVDLGSYLRKLATQAFQAQSTNSGAVQLELNLGSVQVSMDQAIPCGLLINELISNCLKHGFPEGAQGHVSIDLEPQDSAHQWCLRVRDTGVGLPLDFEERRENSLGLLLVGDLARQIGGELQITPNQDRGVSFTVIFLALEPKPLVMPA